MDTQPRPSSLSHHRASARLSTITMLSGLSRASRLSRATIKTASNETRDALTNHESVKEEPRKGRVHGFKFPSYRHKIRIIKQGENVGSLDKKANDEVLVNEPIVAASPSPKDQAATNNAAMPNGAELSLDSMEGIVAADDTPVITKELLSNKVLYRHLNKVSRSFAITIPFMSDPLKDYVALAYLLCRIVDTVEDDAKAPTVDKITWLSDFSFLAADEFADMDVLVRLKERALELCAQGSAKDDLALLKDLDKAVNLLLSFDDEVHETICHGVSILAHGMASSLRKSIDEDDEGISSIDDVDNYCYFVAGVVGEMLAELFAKYDRKIDKRDLMELAVSFGEGLQLTNILRDRAKDAQRGVSFLPSNTEESIQEFVALTQGHLDDAISFICSLSPKDSIGARMFCLTNVVMAMYLLRQVSNNPLDPECKYRISRGTVKRLFVTCRLIIHSNLAIRALAFMVSFGMKRQRRSVRQLRDKVSIWDHSTTTNQT